MKGLLAIVALMSFAFAGEIQDELLETKKVLAAKYDNMTKMPIEMREKYVGSFDKISNEELALEKEISQSLGLIVDEDVIQPKSILVSKGGQS